MDEDTRKSRSTLFTWAIGINVIAWGGYLYLTKVMGIDFELIRQASLAGSFDS